MALSEVSEGLRENNISLQEIKEEIINLQGKLGSSKGGGGFNLPSLPKFLNPVKMVSSLTDSLIKNNPVSKAIRGVRNSMKSIGDSIKAPFKNMSKSFSSMIESMKSPNYSGLIDKLVPALRPLFEPIYDLLRPDLDDLEAKREAKRQGNRAPHSENDMVETPKKSLRLGDMLKSFAKFIPIGLGVLLSGEALQLILKSVKESLGFDANFSILDAINNKAEALFGMPLFGETTTNALKAIGEAFAEGGFIAGIKETVTQMAESLPSLTTALESMSAMWESTKTFFENVVQTLGLGPLRDKISEFLDKEFGIFELIGSIAALKIGMGLLSAGMRLFGGNKLGKNTIALGANTAAVVALTRAMLSGGLGGLDIDGKKRGRARTRYPAGHKINGKGPLVLGQDQRVDAAGQGKSKLGKLGKFGAKFGGLARGIPVVGQILAAGMALYDGGTGAGDALKTFKPQTLTDSIEVGMVGAGAGIIKGFTGMIDSVIGTNMSNKVIEMRDSFLNDMLDTGTKLQKMQQAVGILEKRDDFITGNEKALKSMTILKEEIARLMQNGATSPIITQIDGNRTNVNNTNVSVAPVSPVDGTTVGVLD